MEEGSLKSLAQRNPNRPMRVHCCSVRAAFSTDFSH
jgi:hypothetical protein